MGVHCIESLFVGRTELFFHQVQFKEYPAVIGL